MNSAKPVSSEPEKHPLVKHTIAGQRRVPKYYLGILGVVIFAGFWELTYVMEWTNPRFYSAPSRVMTETWTMILDGTLIKHIEASLFTFGIGFIISLVSGIIMGFLIGWYPFIGDILEPFIAALYSTPRIVLLPLIILWFGVGTSTKVVIVILTAFFPILINTTTGVRSLDQDLLKVARVYDSSDFQIFRTLAFPASIPYILSGVRLGVGQGLIGIVVAEMFVSSAGLGYLVNIAAATAQTDRLFISVLVVSVMGMTLTGVLRKVEDHFSSWRG